MSKEYLNYLNLNPSEIGNARRIEMLNDIMRNGTFLPRTVEYKDIDEAFRDWVKSLAIISDEGKEYPTMTLFSSQRFSEYSQSWKFVDENQNILLNFKTITRENNPSYGEIQGGLWNIPGDRFYTMKRKKVLDDNGSESYLVLKMKQPMAIDLSYKLSIFTTRYTAINEFNTLINKQFAGRQCYIQPNGHFMPMILDQISDESQYNIDDRQFYSQTYQIKVMAYIITDGDYRVEEAPIKFGINMGLPKITRRKAEIEMDELEYRKINIETPCGISVINVPTVVGKRTVIDVQDLECNPDEGGNYYYKPLSITVKFPPCIDKAVFTIPDDINFVVNNLVFEKWLLGVNIFVNEEEVSSKISADKPLILRKKDEVKIIAKRGGNKNAPISLTMEGYSPDIVYARSLDDLESQLDEQQFEDEYEVNEEE